MAKITFADKVKIKDIPVAEINKFTNANANEIKAVVNGLDDDKLTKDLSLLNEINAAENAHLLFLNGIDVNGDPTYNSISVQNLLKNIVTNVNRIVSGGVIWTGVGLIFKSVNLVWELNGQIYTSNNNQITLDVSDATNPRLDLIFLDINGLNKLAGTPSATPSEPSLIDPDNQIKANIVLVNANATTPEEISINAVYLENLQEVGGEWNSATNQPTRINLNNSTSPITGTKDIKTVTAPLRGDTIDFTSSTYYQISDFDALEMDFKMLQTSWNRWYSAYVRVALYDGTTIVGSVIINDSVINAGDRINIQSISILKSNFSITGTRFNKIQFYIENPYATLWLLNFQLDNIKIQGGGTIISPVPQVVNLGIADVNGDNQFTINLADEQLRFDGATYNSTTKVITIPTVGIEEAPNDNKLYGRKNKTWSEVVSTGGAQTLQEVTDEGNTTTNDIVINSNRNGFEVVNSGVASSGLESVGLYCSDLVSGAKITIQALSIPYISLRQSISDQGIHLIAENIDSATLNTVIIPAKSGTLATLDDIAGLDSVGVAELKTELKAVYTVAAYVIDWNLGSAGLKTFTGTPVVVFTETNVPSSSVNKTITVEMTGAVTSISFPANYKKAVNASETYDGTKRNVYVFDYVNGTVYYSNTIYTL